MDADEALYEGIAAVKSGDRAKARGLLSRVINERPNDVTAWLWMSGAVEIDEQRVHCIRRVLQIEPDNERALVASAQLDPDAFAAWLERQVALLEQTADAVESLVSKL